MQTNPEVGSTAEITLSTRGWGGGEEGSQTELPSTRDESTKSKRKLSLPSFLGGTSFFPSTPSGGDPVSRALRGGLLDQRGRRRDLRLAGGDLLDDVVIELGKLLLRDVNEVQVVELEET